MNKPNSLREHLLAKVPALEHNPDRLLVFIDQGSVRSTVAGKSLSWEYGYKLQVILTDFAGHPDTVILPLLGWVSVHQSELLTNLTKSAEGIQFEADIIDASKVDMAITLQLTERVVVGKDHQGATTITHAAEPQPSPDFASPSWPAPGTDATQEWFVPNG